MTIRKFIFNGFQENTYVVNDSNGNAVVVDPGCGDRYEEEALFSFIQENQLNILAVINTHAHLDHIFGVQAVMRRYKCDFYLHQLEKNNLERAPLQASVYGIANLKEPYPPTHWLKGGEMLNFGQLSFKVIHAPGHSPGHVVFYSEAEKVLLNGDVLFQGSFGRTDLPGGSMDELKKSITKKLFVLPEDTLVYCGHGGETTIGEEKQSNYILQF